MSTRRASAFATAIRLPRRDNELAKIVFERHRAAAIARLAKRGRAAYSVSRHLSEAFPALLASAFRRTGETVQGVFDEF